MKKTIYACKFSNGDKIYWYGDKLLRIVSTIAHTIELALIIYLLVR